MNFLNGDPSVLILGDNIFHGNELINRFTSLSELNQGATLLAYPVKAQRDMEWLSLTKIRSIKY